jgi:hypothetical protein
MTPFEEATARLRKQGKILRSYGAVWRIDQGSRWQEWETWQEAATEAASWPVAPQPRPRRLKGKPIWLLPPKARLRAMVRAHNNRVRGKAARNGKTG